MCAAVVNAQAGAPHLISTETDWTERSAARPSRAIFARTPDSIEDEKSSAAASGPREEDDEEAAAISARSTRAHGAMPGEYTNTPGSAAFAKAISYGHSGAKSPA